MVNELLKQKELIEEEKMMNAIHQNYRDIRMNRKMDEQLKKIEKKGFERTQKKMMWAILITGIVSLILEIVIVGFEV